MTSPATQTASVSYRRPRPWTIFDFVKLLAVGFLLIPVAQSLGEQDYSFIRWFVTLVTAYGAYRAFTRKNYAWFILFLLPTVIFNPIVQIHMFRVAWILVDLGTVVLLVLSLTQAL